MDEASDQPGDHAYVYAVTNEEAYLQTDEDEKPAMAAEPPALASIICQFCGKSAEQVLMWSGLSMDRFPWSTGWFWGMRRTAGLGLEQATCW